MIPTFLILLILFSDVVMNLFAWIVEQLNITSSVLTGQWDNMGYTFVKVIYEDLFLERRRSFAYILVVIVSLFSFVLFLCLKIDHSKSPLGLFHSYSMVLGMGISTSMDYLSYHFSSSSFSELGPIVVTLLLLNCRAFFVYCVFLILFGIPLFLFTLLLVIKLQWFPSLCLFVVFIPLWIMDRRGLRPCFD